MSAALVALSERGVGVLRAQGGFFGMSPITQKRPPARWSWLFGTVFVAWTALTSFMTYSYAGASPSVAEPVNAVSAAVAEGTASSTSPSANAGTGLERAASFSDTFADIAERVSPSVVTIKVESKQQAPQQQLFGMPFFFGPNGGPNGQGRGDRQDGDQSLVKGSGSGVIFRADGAILTNNHVVDHAARIDVTLKDGRTFRGKVVGTDSAVDLAVVKIDAKGLPAATFADSARARVGEWVLAIGAPFGLDYTLTAGVLSAKGRGLGANEIEDYLQTDASINPGNSGGPLVDLHGRVLGINTMIIGRGAGIGFAIPSTLARTVGEQLLANGIVKRAWLGVGFQELTPELAASLGKADTHGALVSNVVAKGPADRAGLRAGDIIESVDGQSIAESKDLLRDVLAKPVGAEVKLNLLRDGKVQTLAVKTGERPKDLEHAEPGEGALGGGEDQLGLELQLLTPQIAEQLGYRGAGKVVVSGVRSGSPAEVAGLSRGDVIVEVDRHAVKAPTDLAQALHDGKALLRVDRTDHGDTRSFFAVLSKE